MITFDLVDEPGEIPLVNVKELFERGVRNSRKLSQEFDLTKLESGAYLHEETHCFWLGFATGMRVAQRIVKGRPV